MFYYLGEDSVRNIHAQSVSHRQHSLWWSDESSDRNFDVVEGLANMRWDMGR